MSHPALLRRLRAVPLALLGAALAASCGPSRPEIERFHTSGRVDPRDFPDVPAVVLLDRTELTFTFAAEMGRPYAASLHTRRIQILRPEALDLARVMIPFDDRSRILYVQAKRITQDGEMIPMADDRAVDMMRFKSGSVAAKLYDDKGYKLTKVSGVEVGDVMEVSYLRVYRDPRWVDPIRVSGPLPVVRGEVVVDHPVTYDVDFRVTKLGRTADVKPTRIPTRVKGPEDTGEGVRGTRHVFLFENERALFDEPWQPEVAALATQVHVQLKGYTLQNKRYVGFRNFDDVAAWYRELTAGKTSPDGTVSSTVVGLGGKGGTKRQKLKRVQQFLQNEIKDVPTFLNLAALPARGPGDIINAKFGDSKDQASLGLAMLAEMGIGAFPVLVSRVGTFAAVPDLATPAPFNHVILAVPSGGRYSYIDPATPFLPTGRLPGALQGQRGLLVTPTGAELVDLPEDPPGANRSVLNYDLAVNKEGIASGQVRVELDGLFAQAAREALFWDPENATARIATLLAPSEKKGMVWREVLAVGGEKAKDPDKTLKLQVVLAPGEIGQQRGPGFTVTVEKIVGRPFPFLWREVRYTPLVFPFRFVENTRVTLSMPPTYGIDALPQEASRESSYVNFRFRWAIANGELFYNRETTVDVRELLVTDYIDLRRPVVTVWSALAEPLAVVTGGFRGENYGSDPF